MRNRTKGDEERLVFVALEFDRHKRRRVEFRPSDESRTNPSVFGGDGVVGKIHMAVGLGPQADTP